jgi:hypothetical protein
MARILDACVLRATVNAASVKPISILPLSPIKIFAGGKLNIKKPNILPASDSEMISKSG